MATEVEQLYRLETRNFTSGQYRNTGTAGMEAVPGTDAPYYGWNSGLWQSNPEYAPIGTWSAFENKGLSGVGGTKQNTTHKKRFVKLPSVEAGMMYLSGYILRHDGNPAAWYGGDQRLYNQHMAGYKPTIVNSFYQQ